VNYWMKAELTLVERLGYGWTKDRPAPWEVGLIFAQGRMTAGARLSIRDLSAAMGWSRNRAHRCMREARERFEGLTRKRDSGRDSRAQSSRELTPDGGTLSGQSTRARVLRADLELDSRERERDRARDTTKLDAPRSRAQETINQPHHTQDNHHGQQEHSAHRALAHCE